MRCRRDWPLRPSDLDRICQACFVESYPLISDPATAIINRSFQNFAPLATLSAAANADNTAFIWWLGMNEEGLHWTVQVFVAFDWHDWEKGPEGPVGIVHLCTLRPDEVLSGATMAAETDRVLAKLDAEIKTTNESGFCALLDRDPQYQGPRICKSVRLLSRPDYPELLIQSLSEPV